VQVHGIYEPTEDIPSRYRLRYRS